MSTGQFQDGKGGQVPVPAQIGPEESRLWLMALYGAAMTAVQMLEFSVSHLYLVGNHDPAKGSGSAARQLRKALVRLWESLNQGTASMKLADAKNGVAHLLDEETYDELREFLDGPRNRLAHRFLIQALPALGDGGVVAMAPHALDLIKYTQSARRLSDTVWARSMALIEELPDVEPPPPGVLDRLEKLAGVITLTDVGPEAFRGPRRGG